MITMFRNEEEEQKLRERHKKQVIHDIENWFDPIFDPTNMLMLVVQDKDICLAAVKTDRHSLKAVINQGEEICMTAVRQNTGMHWNSLRTKI